MVVDELVVHRFGARLDPVERHDRRRSPSQRGSS
jgi:hypothetical protein